MQIESTIRLKTPPLRAARVARGLSLRAAAHRSKIDPGHLSKVERGEKQLSIEALYRLSAVLELRELADLLEPFVQKDEAVAASNSDGAGPCTSDAA